MAKGRRPRHGSKAHYPRKRTKRIYPSLKSYGETDEERIEGFLGYKAGMTHVMALDTNEDSPSYGQQVQVPVTVIECPPLKVYGVRTYEKINGQLKTFKDYFTENLDKELERKLEVKPGAGDKDEAFDNKDKIEEIRLLVHTQPKETGLKKKPEVLEIPLQGPGTEKILEKADELLGKEINAKEIFKEGEYVDSIAVTKGKGTQGPVKRFGIKKQERKAKKHVRHPGSLGGWHPARVLWTVPMSGQMGFHKRTDINKEILKLGEDEEEINPDGGFRSYGEINNDYILVKGSVPGPRKRPILLRHAMRPPKKKETLEIKHISTKSQK